MLSPDQILALIRDDFSISDSKLQDLGTYVDDIIARNPCLMAVQNLSFLEKIDHPEINLIKRAGFTSPQALFVSGKIKNLCRLPYRRQDGELRPCGGFVKNYLACSPYSPSETEMKKLFQRGGLFCFLQADGLTDMIQQETLLQILYNIEEYFLRENVNILMSFGAGPCRACDHCAGQFGENCYQPDKRRFSLEACGIDVHWAMTTMARLSGEESWKLSWIKDFGLKEQTIMEFKSVLGVLL